MRVKAFLIGLMLTAPVFGLQKVEVQSDLPATVSVSATAINIIRVEHDRVESVTATNDVEAQHNAKTGEIALKVLTKNPVDLFLLTEKSRSIQLRLIPTDIPAETVVLMVASKEGGAWEIGQPYTKILAELLRAMYSEENLEGYIVDTENKKDVKFKNGKLQLTASYTGAAIKGEIYEFVNTDKEVSYVKELDFYQLGVRAISVTEKYLLPKGKTKVFIIREKA